MDYEVLVLDSDANHVRIACATNTDVENTVVGLLRGHLSKDGIKMMSLVINKLV